MKFAKHENEEWNKKMQNKIDLNDLLQLFEKLHKVQDLLIDLSGWVDMENAQM